MAKIGFRAAGRWVLWLWLLPGWVLGQAPAAPAAPAVGLAGTWRGLLPIPGGAMPLIALNVAQAGAGKPTATLDLPAKRLTGVPATVTVGARDTLVVYAAAADCRFVCVPSTNRQELRGVWSQPGLRVPLVLRRYVESEAAAPAGRTAAAAAAYVYHTEQATVTSQPGDVRLAGTLSIPDGAGPFPAVVLLSDMGAQDRDARRGSYRLFADLAAGLARQGIAVLRLDDRGVGQSGGDGDLATTADLVRDAQAALGYLRVQPSVDAARIGLVGHGEGGNVALLAAAQPLPPAFVVTLAAAGQVGLDLLAAQPEPVASPADTAAAGAVHRQAAAAVLAEAARLRAKGSNAAQVETYLAQQRLKAKNDQRKEGETTLKFRRDMLEIVRQTANNDQAQAIVVNMLRQRYPALDPAAARARAGQLTTPWLRYYLNFDPRPGLAAVQCPVLLLHGTDDAEVTAAANLPVLEKGLKPNKRVTVRRLPGVNHWFQTPASELLATPDGVVDAIMSPALVSAVRSWMMQGAEE